MEITETSSNLDRRSSQTEVWKEIDEQALRVFNEDDVPSPFTPTKEQVGDSAKIHFRFGFYRDILATGKKNNWFGGFIHGPIPGFIMKIWVGAIFMKRTALISDRNDNGWIWSSSQYFPYAYSDQEQGWLYFDLENKNPTFRYYNFHSARWFQ